MTDTNSLRDKIADKTRTASATTLVMAFLLGVSMIAAGPVAATSHDVEVTVNDSTGTAVANATVEILDTSDGTIVETASTDSTGYYETNLSSGDYDILVSADGYEPQNQIVSHTSGTVSTVDFALNESNTTGTIEVTAEDSSGVSIENASVDLIDPADGTVVMTATTDSNGLALFGSVTTGTYDVAVTHADYQTFGPLSVDVTADTVESYSVDLLAPNESQFSVDTAEGTSSALYAELANGTYDVTWYSVDDSGVRTDLTTETVEITNGTTVHEFAPADLADAADGDTYGAEITYESSVSPDADVLKTGVLYESSGAGSGSAGDSLPFGLSEDQALIGGGVIVLLIVITAVIASKPE